MKLLTLSTAEILSGKNARAFLVRGFIIKSFKKYILKIWKKRLPGLSFCFNDLFIFYFFKYKTIETHARTFLPLNISAVDSVAPLLSHRPGAVPLSLSYDDAQLHEIGTRAAVLLTWFIGCRKSDLIISLGT